MSRTTMLVSLINIARLREARKLGIQHKYMSKFAAIEVAEYEEPEKREHTVMSSITYVEEDKQNMQGIQAKNWIPHPRSGIYYPEGHDGVLNDVSQNAASLGQSPSFWLRNIHGAEKHDPDLTSADDYFLTSTPNHSA